MLLNESGRKELASQELVRYAELWSRDNWSFNEWLHGKTGKLMGMDGQS